MKISYAVRQAATQFAKGYAECLRHYGPEDTWVEQTWFGVTYDIHIVREDDRFEAFVYPVVYSPKQVTETDTSQEIKLF